MTDTSLSTHAWWLASRASGLVALVFVTASAVMALMISGRIVRSAGLAAVHRQTAVTAVVAIAVHGITLLGDPWLDVGPVQIAVPFALPYRPLWTGLGVISGYLTAIFGLSFFVRRRIGARLWRNVHKLMIVAYALAVAHVLGAGTDAVTLWLRSWIVLSLAVLGGLSFRRLWSGSRRRRARRAAAPDRRAPASS
jgi:methionine sulfoxide reductase heme-binding subunit